MSSSEDEERELNFGLENYKSTNENQEISKLLNPDECDSDDEKFADINELSMKKYKNNPKTNIVENTEDIENDDAPLEDLLNLIGQEDQEDEEKDLNESKLAQNIENNQEEEDNWDDRKCKIKKVNLTATNSTSGEAIDTSSNTANTPPITQPERPKSSITITKIVKPNEPNIFVEKNSGIRVTKSSFRNESDLNNQLACSYGKYYKLSHLNRYTSELKDKDPGYEWFSIFLIGSKTESKCSAKGNNYVIWNIYDMNNLEKQQDISLFLFGSAYKSHWKANEFEVYALVKPEFLDNNGKSTPQSTASTGGGGSSYFDPNRKFGASANKNGTTNKKSSWNAFATKKLDLSNKVTLSVKTDAQLVKLGIAKDVGHCQSYTRAKEDNPDSSKKCKNFVNLQQAPYCTYHCVQMDKSKPKGL